MKVWVGLYEHRHGSDTAVYASPELAEAARQAIADQWWDKEIGDDIPKPSDARERADGYFEKMSDRRGEYFSVEACDVGGWLTAVVSQRGAQDVAQFIEQHLADNATKAHVSDPAAWQAVADALRAITNDTDAIVLKPD